MLIPCGPAHDLAGVPDLLGRLPFGTLIGDWAFDVERMLGEVEARGAEAVTPLRRSRTESRDYGREMQEWRHQIENFFASIKFRAVTTRYYKTDESVAAAIRLFTGMVAVPVRASN